MQFRPLLTAHGAERRLHDRLGPRGVAEFRDELARAGEHEPGQFLLDMLQLAVEREALLEQLLHRSQLRLARALPEAPLLLRFPHLFGVLDDPLRFRARRLDQRARLRDGVEFRRRRHEGARGDAEAEFLQAIIGDQEG